MSLAASYNAEDMKTPIEQVSANETSNEPNVNPSSIPVQEDSGDLVIDTDSDSGQGKKFSWINNTGKVRKLSNRVRRERENKRFRKLLTPKNALMILNELQSTAIPEFDVSVNPNTPINQHYVAEVVINGHSYQGQGGSKMTAKNDAAEKAVRDIMIEKMKASSLEDESVCNGDQKEEEDVLPILHLASFALHKLFMEWQAEGYEIPSISSRNNSGSENSDEICKVKVERKVTPLKPRKELPPNAAALHPIMLLYQIKPGCEFDTLGVVEASPGKISFQIALTVDNKQYYGVGRSKKEARRNAAMQACSDLGVKYEESVPDVLVVPKLEP